jgi:hypothetical protein
MKPEMKKRFFLDTSAFFKEYHNEEGSDHLHGIFEQDTMQDLERKVKTLPLDLHREVEDYIDFLIEKRGKRPIKPFSLTWKGALRDKKDLISSVDLQHKSLDWW